MAGVSTEGSSSLIFRPCIFGRVAELMLGVDDQKVFLLGTKSLIHWFFFSEERKEGNVLSQDLA